MHSLAIVAKSPPRPGLRFVGLKCSSPPPIRLGQGDASEWKEMMGSEMDGGCFIALSGLLGPGVWMDGVANFLKHGVGQSGVEGDY